MPKVEIEETAFQQSEALRQTVAGMLANPKARKLVLEAQKEAFPGTPVPELDSQKPFNDGLDAIGKRLDAMNKALEDDKAEREKQKNLDELRLAFSKNRTKLANQGWTDEGITGVEKLMEERGIFDHEVGAALFEKLHPPGDPATPTGFNTWNFFDTPKEGEDNLKKLLDSKGEDDAVLRTMVNEALADVRGQPRR
jgi:hypothetical protein